MQMIFIAITLMLIWVHFAAAAALAGPRFGSWAIGRALAVLAVVMLGFCVEHMVGLGPLHFMWPVTTAAALFVLWHKRETLVERNFLHGEIVFGCAMAYALAWRFQFPSIWEISERLPDLVFISNYIDGATLPPVDHWTPPLKFDYYYSLQYYGAALLGRIFNLPLGLTYNMAFVFLSAMAASLLWDLASRFIPQKRYRLLLVAALVCGGTGLSMFLHVIVDHSVNPLYQETMWGSMRFAGEYDQFINTDIGRALFPPQYVPGIVPRALGMEAFSHQYFLGEYHAPLGGYFLLFLALALVFAMEAAPDDEAPARKCWLQAGMGLSTAAIFATNTWFVPFHGALLGGWALWRTWQGRKNAARKPDWMVLILSGVIGFALLYPFLVGFSARTVSTPIRLVYDQDHTPLPHFLGQFWPLLVFLVMGLWNRDTRRLSLFFAVVFGAFLLTSEIVFVDDPSADQYERSNTLMKWWGWIWSGGMAALGTMLLASSSRWIRYVTTVALLLTLTHVYDIANFWVHEHEQSGSLYGTGFYTENDPIARDMFKYLAVAPKGLVLENQYGEGYHPGGAYAAFADKPLFIGWTNQLYNWRGYNEFIATRRRDTNMFYSGDMQPALQWLLDNDIRYIVWNRIDGRARPALWQSRNAELAPAYAWTQFGEDEDRPVGIWVRKDRR